MNNLLKHPDTKDRCIWKILASRRMLVDHIEVIEMCLKLEQNIGTVQKPVLPRKTVSVGCFLTIAASTRFSPSYMTTRWQMVASATSALLLGAIAYEDFFHYRELAKITSLIESIELYDLTMKKVLMHLQEVIYGNQRISFLKNGAKEKEMLQICTANCIKAIYDMYDYVKILEQKTKLRVEYNQFYDPLETLDNCDLFKQISSNLYTAKELNNIFLYMQSHCLLRLSLAIVSDAKISEVKVETNRLIGCLAGHAKELKKQLLLSGLSPMDNLVIGKDVKESGMKKLLSVQHQSLELTVKLTANVQQMVMIDENIQCLVSPESWLGRLQLQDTANNLANVKSHFLTRMDECDRLLITINRLLNNVEHAQQNQQGLVTVPDQEGTSDEPLSVSQNTAHELQDEFFLNTGTEEDVNDCASALYSLEVEDERVAKRLMKKQFQPILQQLRERLVPVEESFKERERVALKLKGITLQNEEESREGLDMARNSATLETDDDSDCEELGAKLKYNRSQNKYKADRDFLASKPQISFLASLPKGAQMDENILE